MLRKRVGQALHAAAGSGAESVKGACEILQASPGFCEHKVVVVGQQLVLEDWDQMSADTLSWYLGEFWKIRGRPAGGGRPVATRRLGTLGRTPEEPRELKQFL